MSNKKPSKRVQWHLDGIPIEIHRALKAYAALKGLPQCAAISEALSAYPPIKAILKRKG